MKSMAGVGISDCYRGHQGVRDLYADLDEAFDNWWWTIRRVVDAGDGIAVGGDFVGYGRSSGVKTVLNDGGTAIKFSSRGLIVWQEWFVERWVAAGPRSRGAAYGRRIVAVIANVAKLVAAVGLAVFLSIAVVLFHRQRMRIGLLVGGRSLLRLDRGVLPSGDLLHPCRGTPVESPGRAPTRGSAGLADSRFPRADALPRGGDLGRFLRVHGSCLRCERRRLGRHQWVAHLCRQHAARRRDRVALPAASCLANCPEEARSAFVVGDVACSGSVRRRFRRTRGGLPVRVGAVS